MKTATVKVTVTVTVKVTATVKATVKVTVTVTVAVAAVLVMTTPCVLFYALHKCACLGPRSDNVTRTLFHDSEGMVEDLIAGTLFMPFFLRGTRLTQVGV